MMLYNIPKVFIPILSLSISLLLHSQPAYTETLDFTVFPISSEMQLGKIQKFLLDAPKGIYLTVGAERGFKAASMMPNITELWLVDISDEIIQFNQINAKLLKAPNRLTYQKLRWEADFNTWQNQKTNLTQSDFDWWVKHVRNLDSMDYAIPEYLNKFGKSPKCTKKNNQDLKLTKLDKLDLAQIIDYKQGNYLFHDNLYARIHHLALNNKIYITKANLAENAEIKPILNKLTQEKAKLSILDLNNLYYSDYIGEEKYIDLVQQLLPFGQPDSVLITMSNYKKLACAQFQLYLGFTFGQLKKWPTDFKMQYFIDSIPEKINDLIDGKLYTEQDTLPIFN
jgi:hypothetical protein